MTDRMAALATLSHHDTPQRSAAFDEFYLRYQADPLVIDKWLALQAAIPEPATLDRVRALTGHAAFSMSNPNRVRALIGSFAHGNQTQFNRADGAGYDFIGRDGARDRRQEFASCRAPDDGVSQLARARTRPPRQGGGRVAAHSPAADIVSADVGDIVDARLASRIRARSLKIH